MLKFGFAALIFFVPLFCSANDCRDDSVLTLGDPHPQLPATRIIADGWTDLYQVDDFVFRSEQPQRNNLGYFSGKENFTVLNLRLLHRDDGLFSPRPGLRLLHIRMLGERVIDADLVAALCVLKQARQQGGTVLVHCHHGRDRTGFIIALYRMVFENVNNNAAIDEMLHALSKGGKAVGLRPSLYPLLFEYLKAVDVPALRERLGMTLSAN